MRMQPSLPITEHMSRATELASAMDTEAAATDTEATAASATEHMVRALPSSVVAVE